MWQTRVFLSVAVVSASLVTSSSATFTTLSQQCWPERVLSSVQFACSKFHDDEDLVERGSFMPISLALTPAARQITNHSPWSHEPACTDYLDGIGDKLCVFTNTSFSGGRGISIFTTPRVAEQFAAQLPFQDPMVLASTDINVVSDSWYTEELPDKGVGMLAKRKLERGDRITAYTPLLLAYHERDLTTLERENMLRVALNQLPATSRDHYLTLAKFFNDPRVVAQDVIKANAFEMQVGGSMHLALFPETSRINHDCAPNSQYYLDPLLLTHFVHATRPIAEGEEITISYLTPLDPTAKRQAHLEEAFRFTCKCPRCLASSASDAALAEIETLHETLSDWNSGSKASPKLAEKLIGIYERNGLEGFLDNPYGFAALQYNAVGDTKRAVEYAKKAVGAIEMKDGTWTENWRTWKGMIKDPKSHWSWRLKKR